ncbi:hypothetical protein FQN60_002833, partial [Etheostoma spectabile]
MELHPGNALRRTMCNTAANKPCNSDPKAMSSSATSPSITFWDGPVQSLQASVRNTTT